MGSLPQKIWRPKTAKFWRDFGLREYLRKGTRYHGSENGVGNCNHSACLFCCMKRCTGLTSSTGCATSWQYWHIVHYMRPLHSTWQASSRRHLRSLVVSTCSAIRCSTETDRSTVPSEDVRLPGFFCGKSVSLECITGQSQRSRADFRHYQASTEDLLLHIILDVLACSAHWRFFW